MVIQYYPDKAAFDQAKQNDDPLLLLVSYDKKEAIVSSVDNAAEHHFCSERHAALKRISTGITAL